MAFRATRTALGEYFNRANRKAFKLSPTQKENARKRLQQTDAVIETLRASGVTFEKLDKYDAPTEKEMLPLNKYFVLCRNRFELVRKSIHKVPGFTKAPLPRKAVWDGVPGEWNIIKQRFGRFF